MSSPVVRSVVLAIVSTCAIVGSACEKPRAASSFVDEYAAWMALPDDEAQRAAAKTFTDRWQGKRVRWQALAVAGLCAKGPSMTCAMNPFPRNSKNPAASAALGGMFPLYRFDDVSYAVLREKCAKLTSCVVDVESRLQEVVLDPELPLALTFVDPVVHAGRAPRDDDGWQRPPPPPRAEAGAPVPGIDASRSQVPAIRLASPTF